MRFAVVHCFVVSSLFAAMAHAAEMTIDTDGMAVVNGQRTFIVGLYENPTEDAVLQGAVDAGINLVYGSPSVESLDRLHEAGAWAWLNTGYDIDLSEDAEAKKARLAEKVDSFAGHPAMLVWEVPDEALWNAWYLAYNWRREDEPDAQKEAIEALEDATLQSKLRADLAEAARLREYGRYAESEALADSIWIALGKELPKPGYGMATAPERAAKLGAGMTEGYKVLRELDPAHPVWMNHAPRNTVRDLAYFNRGADIVGCDIYPVPTSHLAKHADIADRGMTAVGKYTDHMQAAAPGKPVWMVLQGTGWGDFMTNLSDEEKKSLRRPRKDETRFMAYNAIVHGAQGILYWGSQFVEKDSEFWKELLEVTAELDSLQPVLSAPDGVSPPVAIGPTNGTLDLSVRVRTKAAPDGNWHIVVNEFSAPLQVTLAISKPTPYVSLNGDVPVTRDGELVTFFMRAHSVVVLKPEG